MNKHTPTPWRVEAYSGEPYTEGPGDLRIVGSNNISPALIFGGFHTIPELAGNAAHIVHCVNLHDELVAMLARHYSNHKPCGHDFDCVCLGDEARALLSRARGEKAGE